MSPYSETLELRIGAFLDGSMPAGDRAEFERELAADGALREAVELQRFVDASIRRVYVPRAVPLPAMPTGPIRRIGAEPSDRRAPGRRWLAYAAAAALLLTTAWFVNKAVLRANPDFKLQGADTLYALLENKGWKPEQVCTTPQEFGDLVKGRLGQALFPTDSPGIALVGWGYSRDYDGTPISPKTVVLLTTVDGRNVMVLMDRASNDREVSVRANRPGGGEKLYVHRRVIGDLVTYEVSPLPVPRVIPTLTK